MKDVYHGNESEGRSPVKEFINLIDKYEGLYETATMIEGLIVSRGIHASGVFIVNDDFYKYNAIMRSPKMIRTSQWELHDSEEYGIIKYDLLTTKALTKIRKTLDFLIEDNIIQAEKTLKETYLKYINPMTIDYDIPETWELIGTNQVVDLFQFDTDVSLATLSKVKPTSLIELAQTNSLMRLQQQPDAHESPAETFVKYKNDISKAYDEMDRFNVPKEDQKILANVLEPYKFVGDTQESIMALVRVPEITNFSVKESHGLRKAIAKKSDVEYKKVMNLFYEKGKENNVNINTLNYIWNVQIKRQKGYSFSILHCIAYTFIALQEVILFKNASPVYWNTACLTVNAGADDEFSESNKSTNYGKIATAISNMQFKGVEVAFPDINTAKFGFAPDAKNNRIIFGLKGINGIGDGIASAIIANRPYASFNDFLFKVENYKKKDRNNKFGDSAVIVLIKAGSFDEVEKNKTRYELMEFFIRKISDPLSKVDLKHILVLNDLGFLSQSQKDYELRLFRFRKYLYNDSKFLVKQTGKSDTTKYYLLDPIHAEPFFFEHFESNMAEGENKDYEYTDEGNIIVKRGSLDREYNKMMKPFKEQMNNEKWLSAINERRFKNSWSEKVDGNISKWEMDALSYYYHEHELAHVNKELYAISDFSELPLYPQVAERYMYRGVERPRFKLSRICGTVLDKDKLRNTVTLLTTSGVVAVKFYKGQFGFYDKQISEVLEGDSKKTVLEKSWFSRGNKLLVTGYRREGQFITKKYADSAFRHSLQLITDIDEEGELRLQTERVDINIDD